MHCILKWVLRYSSLGMLAFSFAFTLPANAADIEQANHDPSTSNNRLTSTWSDAAVEAWRQGKLETILALNEHLRELDITTEIEGHLAILTGYVNTEVQKELAAQLALSVDGITDVKNNVLIDKAYEHKVEAQENKGSFLQAVNDAGITASIKTQLIASDVKARNISVDTDAGVVTLTGSVESEAHFDLAQTIAQNTEGVFEVENNLMVVSGVAHR